MRRASLILVALLLVAGCAGMGSQQDNAAVAELKNPAGQSVGVARLTQVGNVVHIIMEAKGLPSGPHGVHVHAVGKCDPPDFASAGAHFNPLGKQHGALNPQGSHAGDLPNLTVAPDGTGRLETSTEQLSLGSGPTSVWDADGSAVVIHASPDDFKTDPTGNSGARIACGVLAKPPGR
ncbi:MAG TPA: superoxide dismutase family protein [Methylomirabilota bacterium]|jgi:Cu-Zn family superoxide dismutase|nr:superoxide dismutase family protein [Methylomirabilota bacterium]